jgi:hypothetical protein
MRPLLAAGAVGAARWAPCPRARRASAAGGSPQPAQAAHGRHSLVPKIPGIHRELPGPIHIVAIRQPADF